ncbi:hypothetical protein [Actinomadura chokoriensis]|uniref:Uncharacterized protein n=1 Tax=Actinomadura chokoriensis TaxID=454156 RepID=A0ABV4R918_9ACTN
MGDVTIGAYQLTERSGVWFLVDGDDRIAGTLLPQPDGSWRCRTPAGPVRTVRPPAGVPDAASWVARQIT